MSSEYPTGHPTIYLEGDPNIPSWDQWNGVAKCTILPPRDLIMPVLPYKTQGKLMFPLCRTCADSLNQNLCRHSDAERQILGTWCSPEIKLAVEKGYKIMSVHELYQYPSTMKYDPQSGEDGLLSAYVRCFMALKIQASGWPPGCVTEDQKQKYVDDIFKYDGVRIDPSKVKKNPALRTLAKLILNSFGGKFGEKTQRPSVELL